MYRIFTSLILCFFILFAHAVSAQQAFRYESDISIKEKRTDGKDQLVMGKVFYDKNIDKIIYDIKFPEKELWVIKDTILFKLVNDQIRETFPIPPITKFTFFNLVLSNKIHDFGLKESGFTVEKTEKDKDMVITTWIPDERVAKYLGKVMLSQKNKKLYGVIIYNPEGQIVSKQFFRNYVFINGVQIPQEIIQIDRMADGTENKKITTFSNIKINNLNENNKYNYDLAGK